MPTENDDWLPTRRSLLTRLRQADDHAGWQEFFDTYWRLLYGVARKAGLSDAEAQDAVQDCVITVSRQMPTFRYQPEQCSFKGWLLMILRQRVGRQFQKRMPPGGTGDADTRSSIVAGDTTETNTVSRLSESNSNRLELIWEAEWQQHVIGLATERLKKLVSDEQFQIFDLYVLRGWPTRDVAKALGITSAQIYLAKLRVGRRFKQEIEAVKDGERASELVGTRGGGKPQAGG